MRRLLFLLMAKGDRAKILVVEDEEAIGQGLCDVLTFRGHSVQWAKDGADAVEMGQSGDPDLILLDVMLPSLDGYCVAEQLRAAGVECGIIMLTAKGAEADILRGFEAGADDYVTKPFSLAQLLARVGAVLGRSLSPAPDRFGAGSLTVEASRSVVRGPHGEQELSARELGVMRLLLEDPGRIVSRRALLVEVWGMKNPEGVETRTVDVHLGKLRKKLAEIGPDSVKTVRGQGYCFTAGGL